MTFSLIRELLRLSELSPDTILSALASQQIIEEGEKMQKSSTKQMKLKAIEKNIVITRKYDKRMRE